MKKYAFLAAALGLSLTSAAMAAPINHIGTHHTAVGVGTKEAFIEHKATDEVVLQWDAPLFHDILLLGHRLAVHIDDILPLIPVGVPLAPLAVLPET